MFLVFLAAQNLKNTIPSSPVVGRVERESRFCCAFSCRNPQKIAIPRVAQNLKNTIPSSPVVGRVERESCFWCF